MDRFDRDLETEASHDSTRCLILRFIDADDLLESTVASAAYRSDLGD